jgi:CBS domain-containing protein
MAYRSSSAAPNDSCCSACAAYARADGLTALELIASRGVSQLPVVQNGELLGLIGQEDILKWLSLHATDQAGTTPTT